MEELPPFLQAAAHPLRWRLLGELSRSDRQVHELTALVGEQQSLVSYHLGHLRRAELVRSRRSAADARDIYYRLDLTHCGEQLAAAGGALHPALRYVAPEPAAPEPTSVLFLCTGNSSRSQMAEALLRARSNGTIAAHSAGSRPKPIHPDAIAAMAARGLDLSAARPKHLDEFADRRFGHVITLCDKVREVCPEFPGHPDTIHWSMPDPSAEPDGRPAFDRAADEIAERLDHFLHTCATT
ncbi:ArsR family transcriptional regulator [Dactylosporangium sp. NPDC000244]|uniref:arsenate reductase/protein-tyrosine-phosphatase family protein n=1 Tax=Dactylosporangium sp. NPDC000244 TaxID=3154365 RepID=UPI0033299F1D